MTNFVASSQIMSDGARLLKNNDEKQQIVKK